MFGGTKMIEYNGIIRINEHKLIESRSLYVKLDIISPLVAQ